MSDQYPPPPENPYGQPAGSPEPYGQPQPPANPYGQPAGAQDPYGEPSVQPGPVVSVHGYPGVPASDRRPGTVTAAGWITIVLSALSTLMFGFAALMFVVARDEVVRELEKQPEFDGVDVAADSLVGVLVAMMVVMAVWSLVAIVLGVFVLRRSNVARILLVISSAMAALVALVAILSVVSGVWLIGALAVIVFLFVGGANDWFSRRSSNAIDFRGMGGVEGPPPPAY